MNIDPKVLSALGTLISAAAVAVAYFQLHALRTQLKDFREEGKRQSDFVKEENVKQRTLDVCMKYDTDPTIAESCRRLRVARENGDLDQNLTNYRFDIATLLNYLDLIAIGVHEGLYSEKIARDHMEPIVTLEYDFYVASGRIMRSAKNGDIKIEHYQFLTSLNDKWKKPKRAPSPHHKGG